MQPLFEKKIYLSDPLETVISVKIEDRLGRIHLSLRRDTIPPQRGFISYSGPIAFANDSSWERDGNALFDEIPQAVRDEINQQLVRLKGLIAFL